MSVLSIRKQKVVLPDYPIDNSVEMLLPVKVEQDGVIVRRSQYQKVSVSDSTRGMDSKMFLLENLTENGQVGNLKECKLRNADFESLNSTIENRLSILEQQLNNSSNEPQP